jgi:hypothetical protein
MGTDVLVTKILLGVFGCVPAFDTYFRSGFGAWKFGRTSLLHTAEFYTSNADVIERYPVPTLEFDIGLDSPRRCTRAKVIDMNFFMAGQAA